MNTLPELPTSYDYDRIPFQELRMYCHTQAKYLLVTKELIDFLKILIKDKTAIEIGAGCGDLGKHLNIPMTDNHCQTWPDVKQYYQATEQPTITYGSKVERIDALEAVKKYKPDIVIGAWVTQWISPDIPPPPGGGSVYGIKEDEILRLVDAYVVIGAEEIHKHKDILKYPHTKLDAPFVRSRRTDNKIWIFPRVE